MPLLKNNNNNNSVEQTEHIIDLLQDAGVPVWYRVAVIVLHFTFRCVFLCSLLEIRSSALRLTVLYAIIYVSCMIRLMSKSEKTTLENYWNYYCY